MGKRVDNAKSNLHLTKRIAPVFSRDSSRLTAAPLTAEFNRCEQQQAVVRMRGFFLGSVVMIALSFLIEAIWPSALIYSIWPIKFAAGMVLMVLSLLSYHLYFVRWQSVAMTVALFSLLLCWLGCSVQAEYQAAVLYGVLLGSVSIGFLATPWKWQRQVVVLAGILVVANSYWLRYNDVFIPQLVLNNTLIVWMGIATIGLNRMCQKLRYQHFCDLQNIGLTRNQAVGRFVRLRLVAVDPQTCLANRLSLDRILKQEWHRMTQQRGPLVFLLLQAKNSEEFLQLAAKLQELTAASASCVARFDQNSLAVVWLDREAQPTPTYLQRLQTALIGGGHSAINQLAANKEAPCRLSVIRLHLLPGSLLKDLYSRAQQGLQTLAYCSTTKTGGIDLGAAR